MKRAHLWITGTVQGVGFRWHTRTQAQQRGVAGWVHNLPDGRVEAVFEGPGDAVDAMVSWCRTGPRHAVVRHVEVTWEEPERIGGFEF